MFLLSSRAFLEAKLVDGYHRCKPYAKRLTASRLGCVALSSLLIIRSITWDISILQITAFSARFSIIVLFPPRIRLQAVG